MNGARPITREIEGIDTGSDSVPSRIVTRGGSALSGPLRIGGAKNAALPMMAAALLTDEPCILENVPVLEDIFVMVQLLRQIGAEVTFDAAQHRVTIHAREITERCAPAELVERMRASFLVSGPILARTGEMSTPAPGGCKLGSRPVDVDVRGFKRMGATVHVGDGFYEMRASRLEGADIYMDYPSHTGTENLLMAASLARGMTTIVNAASEPEIIALGNMLRDMGARIEGVGTPHIRVTGVERLHGFHTAILPDRLEAGTFAIGAVITGGEVVLEQVNERDMLPLTYKLREAGAEVWWSEGSMLVRSGRKLEAVEIQALPFPGFPTDLQAAFAVLLTQAEGTSRIFERVFNDRLRYVDELVKMGADVHLKNSQEARFSGPTRLIGADVRALDIRSGACLILAGLIAHGESRVSEIQHVRRGYEDIVSKFASLGADIAYV
ncbi:MAG TPA: UDP-N-acetylglucosamine 1-carboxyvinyltransferase [Thermomicrobiales bacterium]|nr:UDP-N-acetylglucosamine 1-carboxyvinyltransferase [Thermomicrobiales bacterium]